MDISSPSCGVDTALGRPSQDPRRALNAYFNPPIATDCCFGGGSRPRKTGVMLPNGWTSQYSRAWCNCGVQHRAPTRDCPSFCGHGEKRQPIISCSVESRSNRSIPSIPCDHMAIRTPTRSVAYRLVSCFITGIFPSLLCTIIGWTSCIRRPWSVLQHEEIGLLRASGLFGWQVLFLLGLIFSTSYIQSIRHRTTSVFINYPTVMHILPHTLTSPS